MLPGVGVIFLTCFINGCTAKLSNKYSKIKMKKKDKRMEATNEIFNSIEFIK